MTWSANTILEGTHPSKTVLSLLVQVKQEHASALYGRYAELLATSAKDISNDVDAAWLELSIVKMFDCEERYYSLDKEYYATTSFTSNPNTGQVRSGSVCIGTLRHALWRS